ncbi:MAG TPA: S41 family peptidase [Thermoleophilia bacterium]
MRISKRSLVAAAILVLAFFSGFAVAKGLDRAAASATARGQADRYSQVLTDLQHKYYKPLDVAKLGQKGITALLASLNDPYTVYFSPRQARQFSQELSGSYTGIGVAVDVKAGRLTVTRVFSGSPAAGAGIAPGNVIVSVDGTPTAGKPASRDVSRITGPSGTKVRLQLQRTVKPRRVTLTLTRRPISLPLTTSRMLSDHGTKVGYVSLSAFSKGAGTRVHDALAALQKQGAQRIVFDLRDNGGGLVSEAQSVASDFLPAGKVVVTTQGAHSPKEVLKTGGESPTSLPLVVLVNGNTASASEIVTGALQDYHRATIIGAKTFGKGVVQTVLPLSGGAELKITIASYRTPLGRDINHKGLEPTIAVAGQATKSTDPALARALRFIATGR